VSAECTAEIDLRVPDPRTAEEMVDWFLKLEPIGPDVEVTVEGGMNRPPYQKDAGIAGLFEKAQAIYREIGKELKGRRADRWRQRRQLHRGAGHPDARWAGCRRQGRPCRLRADLITHRWCADLPLHAAAGDARLMVTVYSAPNTRAIRVIWVLEEIGVKADIKSMRIRRASTRRTISRSIRPNGAALDRRRGAAERIDGDLRLPC